MKLLETKQYMKQYGTSYYYGNLFFPSSVRQDVYTLYKFVRIPDLIVDNENTAREVAREELEEMFSKRTSVYDNKTFDDTLFGDSAKLFHSKNIPFKYSRDFFDAMLMDTFKNRYENYGDLKKYMYGSAEVVGLMMCHVLGYEPKAIEYAQKLGEAMQLTNFLRDIKEDFLQFDRIYMPEDDLHKFGLGYKHIKDFCYSGVINENFGAFMQHYINKCDELYAESFNGLQYLNKGTRKGVFIAGKLYQQILRKIQSLHYNVFEKSTRTTKIEKIWVIAKYLTKQF